MSHPGVIGEAPPLTFHHHTSFARRGPSIFPSIIDPVEEEEEMRVLSPQKYENVVPQSAMKSIPVATEVVVLPPESDVPRHLLPQAQPEIVEEPLENFVWNEADSSAIYVDANAWHIPSSITVKYAPRIRKLDLSFNCLQTLAGIEFFNALEELVLDNNLLDDSIRFFYNPQMKTLSINKNKITDLERFLSEISLKLPSLTYLSLLGNPACPDQLSSSEHDEDDYRRYRSYVIHRLPNLKFLDSTLIKQAEQDDAQRTGRHYRLVRLNSDSCVEKDRDRIDDNFLQRCNTAGFTPLPYDSGAATARAAYGRLRHRYTGKHSEGNRFIRNHEL